MTWPFKGGKQVAREPSQLLGRALHWLEGEPIADVFEAELVAGGLGGVPGGLQEPATPLVSRDPAAYPSQHPVPGPHSPLPESFTAPLRVLTLNNYAAIQSRVGNGRKALAVLRMVRAAAGMYNEEVAQWGAQHATAMAAYNEWERSTRTDRATYDAAMASIAGEQAAWDDAVASREAAVRSTVQRILAEQHSRAQRSAQRRERRLMQLEDLASSALRHGQAVVQWRQEREAVAARRQELLAKHAHAVGAAEAEAERWDARKAQARQAVQEREAHLERKAQRREAARQARLEELARSPLRRAAEGDRSTKFALVNPLADGQVVEAARCLWKRDPTLPRVKESDSAGLLRLVAGSLPLSGTVKVLVKACRRVQPPITRPAPVPGFRRVPYLYVQARVGDVVTVTTARRAKPDPHLRPMPGAYSREALRGRWAEELDMSVYGAKWKQVVELKLHSGLNAAQHLHVTLLCRTEFEPVAGQGGSSLADSADTRAVVAPSTPPPPEKDLVLGKASVSLRSIVSRAVDKAIDVAKVQPYDQTVGVGHAVNATTALAWLSLARQYKQDEDDVELAALMDTSSSEARLASGTAVRTSRDPTVGKGATFAAAQLECGYGWKPDPEVLGGVLFRAAVEAAGGRGPDGQPVPGYEYLSGVPLTKLGPGGLDAYMIKTLTAAPPPAPSTGMLKVLVHQARKLAYPPGTVDHDLQHTYLVARVGDCVARTKIVRNSNKPIWNEVLEIDIPTGFIDEAVLELRLYDSEARAGTAGSSVAPGAAGRPASALTEGSAGARPASSVSTGTGAGGDDAVGLVRVKLRSLMLGCIMQGTSFVEAGKRSKLDKLHAVEEAKWFNIRAAGLALPPDWEATAARARAGGEADHASGAESDGETLHAEQSGGASGPLRPPRIGKLQLGYGWRPRKEALLGYITRVQDWVRAKAAAEAALAVEESDGEGDDSSVESVGSEVRALAADDHTGAELYPLPPSPALPLFTAPDPPDMRSVSDVSADTQYSTDASDLSKALREAQAVNPVEGLGPRPVPPSLPFIPPPPPVPPAPPSMAPLTQTQLNLAAIQSTAGRHGPALMAAQSAVMECRRELRGARGLVASLQAQLLSMDREKSGEEAEVGDDELQVALGLWGTGVGGEAAAVAPGWQPKRSQVETALEGAKRTVTGRHITLCMAYHALAVQLEHCGHPIQCVRHFQRAANLATRLSTSHPEQEEAPPPMEARMATTLQRDFEGAARLHRVTVTASGKLKPQPRMRRVAAADPASQDGGGSEAGDTGGEGDDGLGEADSVDSFQPYMGPPAIKERHAPAFKFAKAKAGQAALPLRTGDAADASAQGTSEQVEDRDGMLRMAAGVVVDVGALRSEWGEADEEHQPRQPDTALRRGHTAPPGSMASAASESRGLLGNYSVSSILSGVPPGIGALDMHSGVAVAARQHQQRAATAAPRSRHSGDQQQLRLGPPAAQAWGGDGASRPAPPSDTGGAARLTAGLPAAPHRPKATSASRPGFISKGPDPQTALFVHEVLALGYDPVGQRAAVDEYFAQNARDLLEEGLQARQNADAALEEAQACILKAQKECGITPEYAMRVLAEAEAWGPLPGHGSPSASPPPASPRTYAPSPGRSMQLKPADYTGESASEGEGASVGEFMGSQATLPEYRQQEPVRRVHRQRHEGQEEAKHGWDQEAAAQLMASAESLASRTHAIFSPSSRSRRDGDGMELVGDGGRATLAVPPSQPGPLTRTGSFSGGGRRLAGGAGPQLQVRAVDDTGAGGDSIAFLQASAGSLPSVSGNSRRRGADKESAFSSSSAGPATSTQARRDFGTLQSAFGKAQASARRRTRLAEARQREHDEVHMYDVAERPPVMPHDSDSDERPISHRELRLESVAGWSGPTPPGVAPSGPGTPYVNIQPAAGKVQSGGERSGVMVRGGSGLRPLAGRR